MFSVNIVCFSFFFLLSFIYYHFFIFIFFIFFFYLFFFIYLFIFFSFCNKQQDITSIPYFNTLSSFSLIRTFVRLKLTDTTVYMNRQEQYREDPDETVRMHRLSLTFAI